MRGIIKLIGQIVNFFVGTDFTSPVTYVMALRRNII